MIDREGHVGAAGKGRGRVAVVIVAVVVDAVVVDGGVVVNAGVGGGVHSSELANIMTV